MIRKILKANSETISIKLPNNYIGKEVEIIVFATDEPITVQNSFDETLTHFASEKVLAKDWQTAEEDKAWQDL